MPLEHPRIAGDHSPQWSVTLACASARQRDRDPSPAPQAINNLIRKNAEQTLVASFLPYTRNSTVIEPTRNPRVPVDMRLPFLLALLIAIPATAQHCAYDFASLIVVRPQADGDTALIEGLRIVLLDKDNLPATSTGTPFYLFQRNTDRPTQWLHPTTWKRNGKRQFPFAQDNYILVVPNHFHMENYRVLVLDERPGTDGPRYRQQLLHLHPSRSYRLCGRYADEVYQAGPGEAAFTPVNISLFER